MKRRLLVCLTATVLLGLVDPARTAVNPPAFDTHILGQSVGSQQGVGKSVIYRSVVDLSGVDRSAFHLADRLDRWHAHFGRSRDLDMAMLVSDLGLKESA